MRKGKMIYVMYIAVIILAMQSVSMPQISVAIVTMSLYKEVVVISGEIQPPASGQGSPITRFVGAGEDF